MVGHPDLAAVAHRGDLVEERDVLLHGHGPEVLVAALRVVHLDAVEDHVFGDPLRRGLLRLGEHVVLVLEVERGAVVVEGRARDEPLVAADLLLLLAVDVPAAGLHAGLRAGDEAAGLAGDVCAQVVRALAELLDGALVVVEAVVAPGVVAEAEERILELLLPDLLEDLELALVGDDVEVGGKLALLEGGHRRLPQGRPAVIEHEHEGAFGVVAPLGDRRVAHGRGGGGNAECRMQNAECQEV